MWSDNLFERYSITLHWVWCSCKEYFEDDHSAEDSSTFSRHFGEQIDADDCYTTMIIEDQTTTES